MKILHISTSDTGGAGIAALRLHKEMLLKGLCSRFLCLNKTTNTDNVIQHSKFYPRFYHRLFSKMGIPITEVEKFQRKQRLLKSCFQFEMYSFPETDYELHKHSLVNESDVIILHWVSGFLNYKTFFKNLDREKRIFWYIHDFNPIQGGFHTMFDAKRNMSTEHYKIEQKLSSKKREYLKSTNIHYIATSNFSANMLISHGNIDPANITIVPLGIPEYEFKKIDKHIAKEAIGINKNDFVLLTVATSLDSGRKGHDRLIPALKLLSSKGYAVKVVTIGNVGKTENIDGINFVNLGNIWEPVFKSIVFSAADVVVSTSYEETFGQTIIEGYACGSPAIVFNNAALPELIVHNETGFIVNDVDDFVNKIAHLIKNMDLIKSFGENAYNLFRNKYTTSIHVEKLCELCDISK